MTATRKVLTAVLVVLALVAASCGSGDTTEQAEEAATTAAPVTTDGTDDGTTTTADEGEDAETGIDVIQKLAQAMREDDATLLEEIDGGSNPWFVQWLIALRAEPEFTDCREAGSLVNCDVAFGEDFFYAQVSDETPQTTISGTSSEGQFSGTAFPPWDGLLETEAEFRAWIVENHPDLEGDLYGTPSFLAGIKMTRESGELRMELLDEFLEARDAEPMALGDPDTWAWVRHEGPDVGLPEDGNEFEVTSMTHGEESFVVVGYRQRTGVAEGLVGSPIIWTTADGSSWSAADVTAAASREGLYGIAHGSSGFVAVGEVGGDAIGAPPVGAGIVWTSADGSEWSRHVPDEWASFVPRAVESTTDGAYVAVGATDRFRASVWRSDDGVAWTEVGVFEDSETIHLADVVAGLEGLVAVGSRHGGEGSRALVLYSEDGLSWTDVSLDGSVFPTMMTSALHVELDGSDGFVIAGSDFSAEARIALWTSSEGVTWERWPDERTDSFVYIGEMTALPDSGVIVVSGALADAEEPWIETGALWQVATVDGTPTLDPLEIPEDISLGTWVRSVSASDEELVAIGRDGDSNDEIVVWAASSEGG